MSKETFAIINEQDQVVNHIIVDKDAPDFEEVMVGQLAHWNCVRYVETTEEQPVIILDESPKIWTTHNEETGFVLPEGFTTELVLTPIIKEQSKNPADYDHEIVVINGRVYPVDSTLIKENASSRPEGWALPDGEVEVSLSDAE